MAYIFKDYYDNLYVTLTLSGSPSGQLLFSFSAWPSASGPAHPSVGLMAWPSIGDLVIYGPQPQYWDQVRGGQYRGRHNVGGTTVQWTP